MKQVFAFFVSLSLVLILSLPALVLAEDQPKTGLQGAAGKLDTINKDVYGGIAQPIEEVVGGIIQGALALLGVVFLILTVYGGYVWFLAKGEEAEVTRAQGILKTAIIGLIIVSAAYAITFYVVSRVSRAGGVVNPM